MAERPPATVRPVEESEASPRVSAVFEDIKATKKIDFVPAFWRVLATNPDHLELTWSRLKAVMHPEALGRTGKLFAYMHEEVRPDVVIVGKALSGGFYPVSAVLSSPSVLGVFRPGDHGSTFGGNPLACAVARAALKVIVDERLPERSAELGRHALARVKAMSSDYVVAVRGRGLWLAIELNSPARAFCERLRDRGVLAKETHDTVMRIAPPLMIALEDLDWGLDQLEQVLCRV